MSKFITFEGIEGVGKTTQIQLVCDYLEAKQQPFIVTKEPGGTEFGAQVRQILLNPNTSFVSKYTEILLFFADRTEHIESVIKPALASNKWVICDRYMDSTIAYQIWGRGISADFIQQLQSITPLTPDLTILLDLDPEESLERAKNRALLDRFEKESFDFHHRVRNGYLDVATKEPDRVKRIDVTGKTKSSIFEEIKQYLER